ncbi:UNVERIFIED_CONTAM: hypothetical protein HDU68_005093 [Siphonaria sp. JEL0065]|nr:hypothetical protein HDU68_005093 [Siphonaria sp. JEL0065]
MDPLDCSKKSVPEPAATPVSPQRITSHKAQDEPHTSKPYVKPNYSPSVQLSSIAETPTVVEVTDDSDWMDWLDNLPDTTNTVHPYDTNPLTFFNDTFSPIDGISLGLGTASASVNSTLLPSPTITDHDMSPKTKYNTNTIKLKSTDDTYTLKRTRNTEAARKSREKRHAKMQTLQDKVNELESETSRLKLRIAVLENTELTFSEREKDLKNRVKCLENQVLESYRALSES